MKLIGQHGNVNTHLVLAVAELLDQKVAFHHQANLKEASYVKLNPLAHPPVLDTPNGALTSTAAILRYLSSVSGQHFSAFDSASLDMWLCTAFQEFAPVTTFLLNQVYGKQAYNAGMSTKAQGDIR